MSRCKLIWSGIAVTSSYPLTRKFLTNQNLLRLGRLPRSRGSEPDDSGTLINQLGRSSPAALTFRCPCSRFVFLWYANTDRYASQGAGRRRHRGSEGRFGRLLWAFLKRWNMSCVGHFRKVVAEVYSDGGGGLGTTRACLGFHRKLDISVYVISMPVMRRSMTFRSGKLVKSGGGNMSVA
jgi:hypothetical protein